MLEFEDVCGVVICKSRLNVEQRRMLEHMALFEGAGRAFVFVEAPSIQRERFVQTGSSGW
jgi:hypothetical protein